MHFASFYAQDERKFSPCAQLYWGEMNAAHVYETVVDCVVDAWKD